MKWLILLTVLFSFSAYADEFSDFSEESSSQNFLNFNGFIEFEQGMRISGQGPHQQGATRNDYVLANRRFRLQTTKSVDKGSFYAKVDFLNNDTENINTVDIREMRLQYRLSDHFDLSVGRQVSTWGVADMLFINDLFPKNWVANFQGRDMEMLKDPSNSVRLTSYFSGNTLDIVYQPEFAPDTVPTGCQFSVFDPNSNNVIANPGACGNSVVTQRNNNDVDEGEIALSLKRNIGSHELALYAYKGFYKSPKALAFNGTVFVPYYSKLSVYGLSDEGQVGPGIFSFEAGYYDSHEDKSGDNYLVENSKIKYLFGYRQDLSAHFSYGVQVYQEMMMNYYAYESSFQTNNPAGFAYRKKELQSTYTLRLTYKAQNETLWLSLFSYLRPDDKDALYKFEVSKKLNDQFKVVAGVNVFTGEDNYISREFGMLRDDDNIFVRFNYGF